MLLCKVDWFANGLPREGIALIRPRSEISSGALSPSVTLATVLARSCSVCKPPIGTNVWSSTARGSYWAAARRSLHAAPEALVELAMESSPTTIRPNRSPGDIRKYMRQHGATSVVVTTPAGQLMALWSGRTSNVALHPPCSPTRANTVYSAGRQGSKFGHKLARGEHSPSALVCYASKRRMPVSRLPCSRIIIIPGSPSRARAPLCGASSAASPRRLSSCGWAPGNVPTHSDAPSYCRAGAATVAALLPGRFMLGVGTGRASTNTSSATTGRRGRHDVLCWKRLWRSSGSSGKGPTEPSRPILYCRERSTVYSAGAAPTRSQRAGRAQPIWSAVSETA